MRSSDRLIRLPEVLNMVGISRSQIYNLISAGHFPSPIKLRGSEIKGLSTRCSCWSENQVQNWIQEQIQSN